MSVEEPTVPAVSRVEPVELAPGITIGGAPSDGLPFFSGPCAVEGEDRCLEAARAVVGIAKRLDLKLVFKASFDKANRSSLDSFRGLGMEEGLRILALVKEEFGVPILTDIHEPHQCEPAAEVADVLQIPAFLCRQTDLILAAARTGRAINLKKGQFLAPDDMLKVVEKARSIGNEKITVTERGFSFGYHNLVVDMRSFAMLHADGIPVVYDVTHSLQLPGGGKETGGARQYAEPLARAAVAAGADGIFMEIHPQPEKALSDHTTQLPPDRAERLIGNMLEVFRLRGGW